MADQGQGATGGSSRLPWGWIVSIALALAVFGSCGGGDSGDTGGGGSGGGSSGGGYSGTWHEDSNGNPVPDDCEAWAQSTSNPIESSDRVEAGTALCEGYG